MPHPTTARTVSFSFCMFCFIEFLLRREGRYQAEAPSGTMRQGEGGGREKALDSRSCARGDFTGW